jgi:hypothetical protein
VFLKGGDRFFGAWVLTHNTHTQKIATRFIGIQGDGRRNTSICSGTYLTEVILVNNLSIYSNRKEDTMKDTAALSVVSALTIVGGITLGLNPLSIVPGMIGLALARRAQRSADTT